MEKRFIYSTACYHLAYAFFLLSVLGWAYSLTDISEMAFSFLFIHLNDYLVFKAFYSIALGVLILLIANIISPNSKMYRYLGYAQMWLIPYGPFLGYAFVSGLEDQEAKEKARRYLVAFTSVFILYVGFMLSLAFIALIAFGILKNLPLYMTILAYSLGVLGLYSVVTSIFGLLYTFKSKSKKIEKLVKILMLPLVPFGTGVFLMMNSIR